MASLSQTNSFFFLFTILQKENNHILQCIWRLHRRYCNFPSCNLFKWQFWWFILNSLFKWIFYSQIDMKTLTGKYNRYNRYNRQHQRSLVWFQCSHWQRSRPACHCNPAIQMGCCWRRWLLSDTNVWAGRQSTHLYRRHRRLCWYRMQCNTNSGLPRQYNQLESRRSQRWSDFTINWQR